MLSKVGQGSGTAHGYETDIDSLGQAASTHTHTFFPLLFFSLSLQSQGRQQPIDQPGAGNGLGQRGQRVCVCVYVCVMIRLTACWKPLSPEAIQDLQAVPNHLEAAKEKKIVLTKQWWSIHLTATDGQTCIYMHKLTSTCSGQCFWSSVIAVSECHTSCCCLTFFPSVGSWYSRTLVTTGGCGYVPLLLSPSGPC